MKISQTVFASLILTGAALAGPISFKKRQDDGVSSVANEGSDADAPSALPAPEGPSTTPETPTNPSTTTPVDTPSTPSPVPDPGPEDPTEGGETTCRPCGDKSYRSYSLSNGQACHCLGGGDTDEWSWTDKRCVNDYVGLPNDEGKPYFCLGSGDIPQSRQCLNDCNFMLNTVNSASPCNANLYNAARTCASCVPGGAIHYQLDGKTPGGPYINDQSSINSFLDGMKNWCARPSRCIDLTTGGKISGGQCPVLASNPGGTNNDRSNGGNRNDVPAKIVTSNTVTATDADGRPTLSIQLMTIDNPDFTANTEFSGARPTTGSDSAAFKMIVVDTRQLVLSVGLSIGLLAGFFL